MMRRWPAILAAAFLLALPARPVPAAAQASSQAGGAPNGARPQQQQQPKAAAREQSPAFRAAVNLVVIDAEVTDRNGRPIKGLRRDQFEVFEDGKPQAISTFDYEDIETLAGAGWAAQAAVVVPVAGAPNPASLGPAVRNHRLILLFFDLSSLSPDALLRARDAALRFVRDEMTPADLVAVAALGNQLGVLQDFTNDRAALARALARLAPGVSSQLAELAPAPAQEGETDITEDVGAAYTPDDTEFNVFNTDRKLEAMQNLAELLGAIPGKKIVMQFTGGIIQTGEENRTELEAATDAANRSNVSFYTVDSRGLMAEIPGGDLTKDAPAGTAMFTGAAVYRQAEQREDSRDTLTALAVDTGGRAFFDLGDLAGAFRQVQQDTEGYYLLGYTPSNLRPDGAWRSIRVKVAVPGARLRYRQGYFAPKDFTHFTEEDREQQIDDAMRSPSPMFELPVAVETAAFRVGPGEYFVPIAAKLPSGALQWAEKGGRHEDQFDFAAEVRDAASGRAVAALRDTISVRLGEQHYSEFARRALLYQGAVLLPPGNYRLKFLARENDTGRIGTFVLPLTLPVPDPKRLALSSLLLSSQLAPIEKSSGVRAEKIGPQALVRSPLVWPAQDHPGPGAEEAASTAEAHPERSRGAGAAAFRIVPSVTNAFRSSQTLYVFLQAYAPTAANPSALRASLLFFSNGVEVKQLPLAAPSEVDPRTRTATFRFEIPLGEFSLGRYVLQAVVVDPARSSAAFARSYFALLSR
jgi:VWFA-related protein